MRAWAKNSIEISQDEENGRRTAVGLVVFVLRCQHLHLHVYSAGQLGKLVVFKEGL